MGLTAFDEAIAVRPDGDGRYQVLPDERFALYSPGDAVPPAVNGGVLIATVLRAVLDGSPHPHPIATSAHFLRVAALAPAQVQVSWLRQGRTAATARAALVQSGQPVLEVTVTTGALGADPAAVRAESAELSGGWFDEEAEVWDSDGALVAQSRQIARVGRGPGARG